MPICRELNSMKNPDQTDRNERTTVNNHRLKLVSHISRAGWNSLCGLRICSVSMEPLSEQRYREIRVCST